MFRFKFPIILLASWLIPCASAQIRINFDREQRIWNIGNRSIHAVFQLTPEGRFEFRSLTNPQTGDAWVAPADRPVSPIRLQVGTQMIDAETSFRLVGQAARSIDRRGYRQLIVLDDTSGLGRIRLELEVYQNQPALRYSVRFQNRQGSEVKVTLADMLPWSFDDRSQSFQTFRVNQWVDGGRRGNFEPLTDPLSPDGAPVELVSGAHGQHCAWLVLRDGGNRGVFAGWEFDGRADISVRHNGEQGAVDLSGVVQELNHPLPPNEEFRVPPAFIGLFAGDWDDASYATQRFAEAAIAAPADDANFPYVIWDSWKYQQNIDERTLRHNAEIAAGLGVEVFVVDLGWARHIGDWHPDPRKLPSGLRALSDYVHDLGMKFGLHIPFAEASAQSPVLRQNPGWTSSESYGYFEAESLCLSHQPVREWVTSEIVRMIDDYGVDWILQDGENMVKHCTKRTHTHDPGDSNYSNAVDGLNAVVEAARRERPHVVWENCEDGGNMMTYNMVRNYATSIAADDSGPMTTRQAVYGVTYPFPPRYSDRYMGEELLDRYITRSYMFGGPWIFMTRFPLFRQEDLELAASEIEIYKSIRGRIRSGRVFHLTGRPSETGIDALQSYHEATDTSVVMAFRAEAAPRQRIFRLRGLKPDQTYTVRFQEDRRLLVLTGRQIMREGVRVVFPTMWSAEIVYVEPVPSPDEP
ncbi:MAG: alpha-galactosidase [Bryobacteraceae bacterium]